MKIPELEKVDPEKVSDVRVEYFLGNCSVKSSSILVVKFAGVYGIGSEGNGDAAYMYMKGLAGITIYEPYGIILDLRDLDYKWGDMMDYVFNLMSKGIVENGGAVIVGEMCREAIGTLIHGIDSTESPTTEDWVYDTLDSAWIYVEEKIREYSNKFGY